MHTPYIIPELVKLVHTRSLQSQASQVGQCVEGGVSIALGSRPVVVTL